MYNDNPGEISGAQAPRGYEHIHPALFALAQQEIDDHPDLLAQIDGAFTHIGVEDLLATEESRAAFIDQMDPDTLVSTLTWLNGIITGTPVSHRRPSGDIIIAESADIETGATEISNVYPAPEDRIDLLGEVLRLAQSEPDLELKAAILGYGIGAVHAFRRANGRLARMVYYLIMEGYHPGDETLRALLSSTGRQLIDTGGHEVQEKLLERIRLETMAYITECDEPVPALILETASGPRNLHRVFEKGRPGATDRDEIIFHLLTRTPYREILPTAAGRYYGNETTMSCVEQRGDRVYFALDRFWRVASSEDMELYYEIYRDTAKNRVEGLLGLLNSSRKSPKIKIASEDGRSPRKVPIITHLVGQIRRKEPLEESQTA
jgi:hypothetical protein